jgi:hypothetical protein
VGIFNDEYEEETESYQFGNKIIEEFEDDNNKYLSDSNKALELISKIIGITKKNNKYEKLKKLERLIERDFLKTLMNMPVVNKVKIQNQLFQLTKKLYEEQEYKVLKEKVTIGVGGKFSSGKSSFINSLLNMENPLPENQNPTTSIPTYLIKDVEEYIDVFTKDNQRIPIEKEGMQALTHEFFEKYKIGFSSFVKSIVISNPKLPYNNFAFLDTPGYSKAGNFMSKESETDKEKAFEQLKKVNYLIWLIDIENGDISNTDIKFIQELKNIKKILIILNKSDKKTKKEIKKIINKVNETVKNENLMIYNVIPFSSKDNSIKEENFFKIQQFLDFISRDKVVKTDDIFEQISEIKRSVGKDIVEQIRKKEFERNKISEIIFKSNDIFEIETLVEIYGKILEKVRELKRCKYQFEKKVVDIEKNLKEYFGGINEKSI